MLTCQSITVQDSHSSQQILAMPCLNPGLQHNITHTYPYYDKV